eukprot:753225-Hanusia_phi.AAC.6
MVRKEATARGEERRGEKRTLWGAEEGKSDGCPRADRSRKEAMQLSLPGSMRHEGSSLELMWSKQPPPLHHDQPQQQQQQQERVCCFLTYPHLKLQESKMLVAAGTASFLLLVAALLARVSRAASL